MSNKREVALEKDGIEITVMASSVARYEDDGWTRVEDGSSEENSADSAPVFPPRDEVPADPSDEE